MFTRLKEFLEIWPTTSEALEKRAACVKTGHHCYVVKNKTGQAEAQQRETAVLCSRINSEQQREDIRRTVARELERDTTLYPKLLTFGSTGTLIVAPLSYDVNIADMMDL
ncbi:hypothetical protein pEaSNUABM5_00279 [Erwinia phage pEa_SNUABM_5]|uniref:Uncharacterized protein n=1 Tax=Erwinia phage pEa_SNUABM_5 TaxID=2797313 RepID=A0A7T8IVT4_9CAUD|nr:hypothetical protein MPK73_gp279 [Erwinia phage pEa_SNUABM_5]QQO90421.1 hypothetical protein pEaSNUABM5_00279 [Erwinia phage pEa_SNUABM_5]